MKDLKKFPFPVKELGIKSLLPDQYMLAFFKKFCLAIESRTRSFRKKKNARHGAKDFLKVFFFSEMSGKSIHEASEMLNEYFQSHEKGRKKIFKDGRRRRAIPHQTDVNRFLRKIGLRKARNILRECLDYQLLEAFRLGLISRKVNVLIDFTEHPYHGKRDDNMIKGTTRQKGTRKMRHYLSFSVLSRGVHLHAGLEHVARGKSKIPVIINFLDHLLDLGFELNYVLMDREFYRVELLDEIKGMGGNVLIPAKGYKKIKEILKDYLDGRRGRIRQYKFSSTPGKKHRFFQNVYLIIKAKRGFTLREIKSSYSAGTLTLKEAMARLFVIMTTERPKKCSGSWASRTARFYKKRWTIETSFSDINRINHRWRSNHDNVRYLDMLARLLLYNSWKMDKKLLEISARKSKKSVRLTLSQNQGYLVASFLSMEKKSRVVVR